MEEINSRLERKRKWMHLLLSVSMVSLMGIFMLSNMIEEYDDESRYTVVMHCYIETEPDINMLKEDSYVLEEHCEQIRVEDNRGSLVIMYTIVTILSIFSINIVLEAVGIGREITRYNKYIAKYIGGSVKEEKDGINNEPKEGIK